MSASELTLTNNYWSILRYLSDDIKLRLATLLTSSVVEDREKATVKEIDITKEMLAKYAGAMDDERPADEIIADIYNSRSSRPVTEFSL